MKIALCVLACLLQLGCSQASYDRKVKNTSSNTKADSTSAELETTEELAETTEVLVSEPVMVAGSFLFCQIVDDIYCRIDTKDQKNIPIDAAISEQFFIDNVAVESTRLDGELWRWKLPVTLVASIKIDLSLEFNGNILARYSTFIENQILHLGDGTTQLQGCSQETLTNSVLVGLSIDKKVELARKGSLAINIGGLCGIGRADDSRVEVLNAQEIIIFTEFLPTTPAPLDIQFLVPDLDMGEYTVRVSAGIDPDPDDLFMTGFGLSPIPTLSNIVATPQ
ncbi:hypothetical protein [Pseudobacteriovorax antillogorgiicola]|uniref:DUF4382 domain-containing protein n=1 Tax=Pseudobacteriovorax antillogorgiicola TaxID=1513793 RepID=A0A1Y6CS10_9BACT|nr:hypothetical protein [Pseudobacteriovorax antillogorgiicola]TCS40904.1 hypothetical protein EDD56_1523 [Pseudobacteriovorax antillogorgiicola]SMF84118.1 hypothetical protein SAMN06296036_15211 [Pseudobacteriovorax antillogorgiicola]